MIETERGYEECYAILREHGKTFHVMAKLLGHDRGRAIAALYGFARTSDDTVDEAEEARTSFDHGPILKQLDGMRTELKAALLGQSAVPRYVVLADTIKRYGIEFYPFHDLLAGVSMDLSKWRYKDFNDLALYCYRVAGTIGLMITPVAGFDRAHPQALEYAKTLGIAFQLTNILRDIGDDLKRGRIYLPQDELARFGITDQDLIASRRDAAFKEMMEFQIERAFALYREGLALIPLVETWGGRLAFRFAIDAYSEIMNKIRANDYDVYTMRAHLTFWEKIAMIPKSWWRARKQVAEYKRSLSK